VEPEFKQSAQFDCCPRCLDPILFFQKTEEKKNNLLCSEEKAFRNSLNLAYLDTVLTRLWDYLA
jgi:hypothetical protein